jgi:hypothetical protein
LTPPRRRTSSPRSSVAATAAPTSSIACELSYPFSFPIFDFSTFPTTCRVIGAMLLFWKCLASLISRHSDSIEKRW